MVNSRGDPPAHEESFQTYAANGQPLGLERRSEVHRLGLWHKSTQIMVYRLDGQLLLQQRSALKDLHPDCWDSSVGEHLQPGESYREGALRGLYEELAIALPDGDAQLTPLGPEGRLKLTGEGFKDYEMQVAFRCDYDGAISFNEEVQAIRWVDRTALESMLSDPTIRFTPWFERHLKVYELLNSLS